MNTELTDRQILEACARACGLDYIKPAEGYSGALGLSIMVEGNPMRTWDFDPLTDDGDCARMENKCWAVVDCRNGLAYWKGNTVRFAPGNDESRRRASCLVVARAQLSKEQPKQ